MDLCNNFMSEEEESRFVSLRRGDDAIDVTNDDFERCRSLIEN